MRPIDADVLKQHIDKLPALPDGNFAGNHSALKALINMQPTIEPSTNCSEIPNSSDTISRKAAIDAAKDWYEGLICGSINGLIKRLNALPTIQPEPHWISVTERLPDNADHPGAFCPRYQVVTPYGVTEGWYRPHDHEKGGQWFALFWFMSQIYEIWNIDFERGDVPKVIGEAPVMEWRPLPEPYKPNEKQSGKEGA